MGTVTREGPRKGSWTSLDLLGDKETVFLAQGPPWVTRWDGPCACEQEWGRWSEQRASHGTEPRTPQRPGGILHCEARDSVLGLAFQQKGNIDIASAGMKKSVGCFSTKMSPIFITEPNYQCRSIETKRKIIFLRKHGQLSRDGDVFSLTW